MNEQVPLPAEIEEARKHPGGWVYRIAGVFRDSDPIPAEAVVGAWQVDESGKIFGKFRCNPNYGNASWPFSES